MKLLRFGMLACLLASDAALAAGPEQSSGDPRTVIDLLQVETLAAMATLAAEHGAVLTVAPSGLKIEKVDGTGDDAQVYLGLLEWADWSRWPSPDAWLASMLTTFSRAADRVAEGRTHN